MAAIFLHNLPRSYADLDGTAAAETDIVKISKAANAKTIKRVVSML